MNALVIYYSKFDNTKLVAEAISQGLEANSDVRAVHSDEVTTHDMNGADLVIMGSPTHKMNLPKELRPFFENLPKRILKGKAVAAFDTSYEMSWWLNHFTAGKRVMQKLIKLGGKRVVPPEIFLVSGREGPMCEGEIERAKEWAISILSKLPVKFF